MVKSVLFTRDRDLWKKEEEEEAAAAEEEEVEEEEFVSF